MLSPMEAAALERGQQFKRYVRAAAALSDVYDDVHLAELTGVQRGAVFGWWRGSRPSPETLHRIADATHLSVDELGRFTYYGGPPPHLPDPAGERREGEALGAEAERALRDDADSGSRATPRAPRGTAGSDR